MAAVEPGCGDFSIRYIFGENLGSGQFGTIRKCFDKFTGEMLACKAIPWSKLDTAEARQSAELEIDTMTQLSGHPNIVHLKDVHQDEECVHLMMELCSGGDLFSHLKNHGKFSEARAKNIFRSLMEAVAHCHSHGIVHRDLKPGNILLADDSSSSPIKVADFGFATIIEPGQCLHDVVGTPYYIAPEVLGQCYDQAADIWSAGVILYVLLSGRPPFWGKTSSELFHEIQTAHVSFSSDPWDQVSLSAKKLIWKILKKDPSKRPTARQVLEHPWMRVEPIVVPNPMKAHVDGFLRRLDAFEEQKRIALFNAHIDGFLQRLDARDEQIKMSQDAEVKCRLPHTTPFTQNHGLVT